ncbi:MAG: hypothetical protein ACFE9D_01205 [Promethearchaeota archaeon]
MTDWLTELIYLILIISASTFAYLFFRQNQNTRWYQAFRLVTKTYFFPIGIFIVLFTAILLGFFAFLVLPSFFLIVSITGILIFYFDFNNSQGRGLGAGLFIPGGTLLTGILCWLFLVSPYEIIVSILSVVLATTSLFLIVFGLSKFSALRITEIT